MFVPKTTIYKNDSFILCKDYIRFSGQPWVIFSVTVTTLVQILPYSFLRLSIFPSDL